jgi:hypothetical protein
VFVDVQKYLQISIFSLRDDRGCSPLFTWVGVKLVSANSTMALLNVLISPSENSKVQFRHRQLS